MTLLLNFIAVHAWKTASFNNVDCNHFVSFESKHAPYNVQFARQTQVIDLKHVSKPLNLTGSIQCSGLVFITTFADGDDCMQLMLTNLLSADITDFILLLL